jgi:hypothetical protein
MANPRILDHKLELRVKHILETTDLSLRDIGRRFGCSVSPIQAVRHKYRIERAFEEARFYDATT